MLLFKKILNFKGPAGVGDKRGATRYPVGPKYPLKAKVTLVGRDGQGNVLKADDNRAMDWGGQLVNLSSGGVSMRIHPAAMGERGENCRLKLELDHRLFEIDGTVAHFWSGPQHATVGIALAFPDNQTQKAFRQLVEPVAVGASLEPVEKVKQDVEGLKKEQYQSDEENVLSIWRDAEGKNIEHFELRTHGFYIRGSAASPGLQLGSLTGPALTPTQTAEVRELFKLIIPNISKAVPAEVRAFLERFAG
ncbi:MAG TPA: PilZ domain-containing protein [Lacunisphaera sp.]